MMVFGIDWQVSCVHRSLISSRPFMTSINVFLCLLGASRAAYLMLDPYNLRQVNTATFQNISRNMFPSLLRTQLQN